jgi:hypothetical protein
VCNNYFNISPLMVNKKKIFAAYFWPVVLGFLNRTGWGLGEGPVCLTAYTHRGEARLRGLQPNSRAVLTKQSM